MLQFYTFSYKNLCDKQLMSYWTYISSRHEELSDDTIWCATFIFKYVLSLMIKVQVLNLIECDL